jgi:hypothetical protein
MQEGMREEELEHACFSLPFLPSFLPSFSRLASNFWIHDLPVSDN